MCNASPGVRSARVQQVHGMPRLCVDGTPTPPLIFFFNTHIPGEKSDRYLAEQVRLAAGSGVHLYSFPLPMVWPAGPDGRPDYRAADRYFEAFIRLDPEARFIPRVYAQPYLQWTRPGDVPQDEFARFADGTTGAVSIASDLFWTPSDREMARHIRHMETSPYGSRILGYHIGGPDSENFHQSYREKGPDYSVPNQRRFRAWLARRYRTDAALQLAWGRPDVSLATAPIPRFEPGRFPMHGAAPGETIQFFYRQPQEQDWIDFSEYSNEIVADRIIRWARLIQHETHGRKLSVFFYGYTCELPGSFSGHFALHRVLRCPAVHVLVSPYSYVDRFAGGTGSFMSLVDTISAHGKLWLNEDDTRTHLIDPSERRQEWALFSRFARDLDETHGILERNVATALIHRAGTWWMDLVSLGAFNHPSLWDRLRERRALFEEVYRQPQPYQPEVAILVDERSRQVVKSDWEGLALVLLPVRDESAKSGASVGYYSLSDFIEGLVPRCKAYVFANAFRLDPAQVRAIRSRLDRERATAIWIYAPGYLGAGGPDLHQASALTGLCLRVVDGVQATTGTGALGGLSWGPEVRLTPRLVVEDSRAEVLGRYRSDGRVSAARVHTGQHTSVFLGSLGVTAPLLTRLFEGAGAHIWLRGGEVVRCDGRFLMVHTGTGGERAISLPPGVRLEAILGEVAGQGDQRADVRLPECGTFLARIQKE